MSVRCTFALSLDYGAGGLQNATPGTRYAIEYKKGSSQGRTEVAIADDNGYVSFTTPLIITTVLVRVGGRNATGVGFISNNLHLDCFRISDSKTKIKVGSASFNLTEGVRPDGTLPERRACMSVVPEGSSTRSQYSQQLQQQMNEKDEAVPAMSLRVTVSAVPGEKPPIPVEDIPVERLESLASSDFSSATPTRQPQQQQLPQQKFQSTIPTTVPKDNRIVAQSEPDRRPPPKNDRDNLPSSNPSNTAVTAAPAPNASSSPPKKDLRRFWKKRVDDDGDNDGNQRSSPGNRRSARVSFKRENTNTSEDLDNGGRPRSIRVAAGRGGRTRPNRRSLGAASNDSDRPRSIHLGNAKGERDDTTHRMRRSRNSIRARPAAADDDSDDERPHSVHLGVTRRERHDTTGEAIERKAPRGSIRAYLGGASMSVGLDGYNNSNTLDDEDDYDDEEEEYEEEEEEWEEDEEEEEEDRPHSVHLLNKKCERVDQKSRYSVRGSLHAPVSAGVAEDDDSEDDRPRSMHLINKKHERVDTRKRNSNRGSIRGYFAGGVHDGDGDEEEEEDRPRSVHLLNKKIERNDRRNRDSIRHSLHAPMTSGAAYDDEEEEEEEWEEEEEEEEEEERPHSVYIANNKHERDDSRKRDTIRDSLHATSDGGAYDDTEDNEVEAKPNSNNKESPQMTYSSATPSAHVDPTKPRSRSRSPVEQVKRGSQTPPSPPASPATGPSTVPNAVNIGAAALKAKEVSSQEQVPSLSNKTVDHSDPSSRAGSKEKDQSRAGSKEQSKEPEPTVGNIQSDVEKSRSGSKEKPTTMLEQQTEPLRSRADSKEKSKGKPVDLDKDVEEREEPAGGKSRRRSKRRIGKRKKQASQEEVTSVQEEALHQALAEEEPPLSNTTMAAKDSIPASITWDMITSLQEHLSVRIVRQCLLLGQSILEAEERRYKRFDAVSTRQDATGMPYHLSRPDSDGAEDKAFPQTDGETLISQGIDALWYQLMGVHPYTLRGFISCPLLYAPKSCRKGEYPGAFESHTRLVFLHEFVAYLITEMLPSAGCAAGGSCAGLWCVVTATLLQLFEATEPASSTVPIGPEPEQRKKSRSKGTFHESQLGNASDVPCFVPARIKTVALINEVRVILFEAQQEAATPFDINEEMPKRSTTSTPSLRRGSLSDRFYKLLHDHALEYVGNEEEEGENTFVRIAVVQYRVIIQTVLLYVLDCLLTGTPPSSLFALDMYRLHALAASELKQQTTPLRSSLRSASAPLRKSALKGSKKSGKSFFSRFRRNSNPEGSQEDPSPQERQHSNDAPKVRFEEESVEEAQRVAAEKALFPCSHYSPLLSPAADSIYRHMFPPRTPPSVGSAAHQAPEKPTTVASLNNSFSSSPQRRRFYENYGYYYNYYYHRQWLDPRTNGLDWLLLQQSGVCVSPMLHDTGRVVKEEDEEAEVLRILYGSVYDKTAPPPSYRTPDTSSTATKRWAPAVPVELKYDAKAQSDMVRQAKLVAPQRYMTAVTLSAAADCRLSYRLPKYFYTGEKALGAEAFDGEVPPPPGLVALPPSAHHGYIVHDAALVLLLNQLDSLYISLGGRNRPAITSSATKGKSKTTEKNATSLSIAGVRALVQAVRSQVQAACLRAVVTVMARTLLVRILEVVEVPVTVPASTKKKPTRSNKDDLEPTNDDPALIRLIRSRLTTPTAALQLKLNLISIVEKWLSERGLFAAVLLEGGGDGEADCDGDASLVPVRGNLLESVPFTKSQAGTKDVTHVETPYFCSSATTSLGALRQLCDLVILQKKQLLLQLRDKEVEDSLRARAEAAAGSVKNQEALRRERLTRPVVEATSLLDPLLVYHVLTQYDPAVQESSSDEPSGGQNHDDATPPVDTVPREVIEKYAEVAEARLRLQQELREQARQANTGIRSADSKADKKGKNDTPAPKASAPQMTREHILANALPSLPIPPLTQCARDELVACLRTATATSMTTTVASMNRGGHHIGPVPLLELLLAPPATFIRGKSEEVVPKEETDPLLRSSCTGIYHKAPPPQPNVPGIPETDNVAAALAASAGSSYSPVSAVYSSPAGIARVLCWDIPAVELSCMRDAAQLRAEACQAPPNKDSLREEPLCGVLEDAVWALLHDSTATRRMGE